MVAIQTLLFLITGAAAVAIKRDAVTVFEDLQKIDTDTNTFTQAVANWDGSFFTALGIQGAESQVQDDIKTATTDTNALNSTVTEGEVSAVISYINGTLEPDVATTISTLISRKADFQSADLTGLVSGGIQQTQSLADSLAQALIAKAPADQQAAAKAVAAKLDADFQKALTAFQS